MSFNSSGSSTFSTFFLEAFFFGASSAGATSAPKTFSSSGVAVSTASVACGHNTFSSAIIIIGKN
jgi:hypothetical protein